MDSNTGFNIPLNPLAHKSYLTFKKKTKDFLPLDAVWKSNLLKGEPLQLKNILKYKHIISIPQLTVFCFFQPHLQTKNTEFFEFLGQVEKKCDETLSTPDWYDW